MEDNNLVQTPVAGMQPLPAPVNPQPSLKDYASGASQVLRDLQRQTDAYDHFKGVVASIDAYVQDPSRDIASLPFLVVRFPSGDKQPGEVKVDLNAMQPPELGALRPMFEMLERSAGRDLLTAWESLQALGATTAPIVAAARQSLGG